jgi:hypothetical protein
MSGSELYAAWLTKYSPVGNPVEALAAVKKEVELAMREQPPPLEVRVAALEGFGPMFTEFVLSMLYTDEIALLPPEAVVQRGIEALEFLRLAALAHAIELDKLANQGEGEA